VIPGALLALALAAAHAGAAEDFAIDAGTLEDKVRGGFLGQVLGDLNGLAHEMKYIEEPGDVAAYTPGLPEGAWTDDDTDIEWVYAVEMERSRESLIPPARIRDLWLRHLNAGIWCSNRHVRELMEIGFEPPLTGLSALNPWAEFNLSGQFASETWGLVSPGMPRRASKIALHYTRVSVDLEPLQSAQLFATMVAAAFLTEDIGRILDAGEAALDPRSEMLRAVRDVRRWHGDAPNDWKATRRRIRDGYARHGGRDLRDRNGVVLNGAASVGALLHGRGDFAETLRLAFCFGWDCDNNAAAAGAILGVIRGRRWIEAQGWRIADRYRNTSRAGMPEDETLSSYGGRLVALAGRGILAGGGIVRTEGRETVYRIRTEPPGNVEPLAGAGSRIAELRATRREEIEAALRGADPKGLARAAYLASALDLAPDLRKKEPAAWARAAAALETEGSGLLRILFYETPLPAGATLREKALAAGIRRPARAEPRGRRRIRSERISQMRYSHPGQ
jgi:hypothetical protein